MSASIGAIERPRYGNPNTIFKSGHLLIPSKGLGWKSWKKRWFILTRTSLVFFKSDPGELSQRGGELNLTLGGIDLNNSGSVVVREDKKLLTVLFPNGRDGGAITLKSETYEDLLEWKTALTNALSQAPDAALVMGHTGIYRSDSGDSADMSFQQWRERPLVNSLVVGRPISLALEDTDGGPSFLEKALRFLENYGVEVKEILRQSADVEEVDRRIQEYEQGKTEFYPTEDAHVIGDCVKYVLRELPSSPVTTFGCTALLNDFKIDSMEARVTAMRTTIQEAFPEPNRRLLQRVLKMMHTISSNASENRMTQSAVSVCMAPLLLRPLVAGECGVEDDYDINGDDSSELLAAASAAYNAHAIIKILLEQYDKIFGDDILHGRSVSVDSQTDNIGSENSCDDEDLNTVYHDTHIEADFDGDRRDSEKLSENSGFDVSDLYGYKTTRESLILQANLERRKQELKERHFILEQDVARMHQQLQAETDLQAALGFGISTSSVKFSSSRGIDSNTRAELEEIALAEAAMARLKQKVAELHHQLVQQRQHHYQLPPNQSSGKYLQSDFDKALALSNNARKQRQRTRDLLAANLRTIKGQLLTSRTTRRLTFWKSDSKSVEASTTLSMDDPLDSASLRSTSSVADAMETPRRVDKISILVALKTRKTRFQAADIP